MVERLLDLLTACSFHDRHVARQLQRCFNEHIRHDMVEIRIWVIQHPVRSDHVRSDSDHVQEP